MAPSFDCLICVEDTNSIFNNDGDDNEIDESDAIWNPRNHRIEYKDMSFDNNLGFLLPVQSDECLGFMIEREIHHLVRDDYLKRLRFGDLDLGARNEIVGWIGKVNAYFNFGPLCAYLSINYLDRFLSAYELPGKSSWMMQLLGVACVSIAAKMEEIEVPHILDLQVCDSKYVFEGKTIQRMELLVLSTLKWRMQAVTPFSFIDYFLCKIGNGDDDDDGDDDGKITPRKSSNLQSSIQLILTSIKGIDFLEFKPSEIAAAVAISVAGENQSVLDIDNAISFITQHIQKERVVKCIALIHDLGLISGCDPVGVLDAGACLSYKTDETPVGSCANSLHSSPDNGKRRKLNANAPFEVEL